ncbi:MAG: clostripain-related cysteine peptidase [Spirochaetia bacterium]
MAMIEVAYELRNDCSYMIASQENEPGDGWEYDNWLENFIASDLSVSNLLKSVVDGYAERYIQYSGCTLSAIDLSKVDDFMSAYNSFCNTLYSGITTASIQSDVRDAFWDAEYFWSSETGGDHNIDIWSFADVIQKNLNIADTQAGAVKTAVDNLVIEEWHNTGHPGAKGLNIHNLYVYSDYSYTHWKSYTSGYPAAFPVSFVNNSQWRGTYDSSSGGITGPGLIYRVWFHLF